MYKIDNSRIFLKEITSNEEDTDSIVKWRNSEISRKAFFINSVLTPDAHRNFIKNKKPNDVIFMICCDEIRIGMIALKVDISKYSAEYGRVYIDDKYRNKKYAQEATISILSYGFDILNLNNIWLEVHPSNAPAVSLYHKIGWVDVKNIMSNIIVMEYTKEMWNKNKNEFFNKVQSFKNPYGII